MPALKITSIQFKDIQGTGYIPVPIGSSSGSWSAYECEKRFVLLAIGLEEAEVMSGTHVMTQSDLCTIAPLLLVASCS